MTTKGKEPNLASALEHFADNREVQGPEWSPAQIVPDHFRFHDGINSSAKNAEGWITAFQPRCPDGLGLNALQAYGYRGPSVPYTRDDTWQSLEVHRQVFARHLPHTRCQVVPIGFSLGSNVVLLGSSAALHANSDITIPAVILIAPAHGPNEELLHTYREYLADLSASERRKRGLPYPIIELAGDDSFWRDQVAEAYTSLAARGTKIHVVFSDDDLFAAYTPPTFPDDLAEMLEIHSISPGIKGGPPRDAEPGEVNKAKVRYHIRFRTASETFSTVCSILQKYSRPRYGLGPPGAAHN